MTISGFINVLKPAGVTSHYVVAAVRRAYHKEKVGHLGTLDPAAAGVLPLAIGRATRLIQYVRPEFKVYRGFAVLGISTETGDAQGKPIAVHGGPFPSLQELREAAIRLTGEREETVPAYSAVQVDGRRLYSYARSGEAVPEIKRRSTVYDFSISDLDLGGPGERPRAFFEARVSPGTYIRSLIEALGREFSLPSYTGFLLRVADGEFSLDDAATLAEAVSLPSVLLPADQPLSRFGVVNLPADDALAFHQGQRRHVAETPPDGLVRVYGPEKAFMGLGKMVSGVLQPECVL